jgi:hypothetical protein
MASKIPMEAIEEEKPVWFENPGKAGANEYVPCFSYNSKPLAKPRRNSLGVCEAAEDCNLLPRIWPV